MKFKRIFLIVMDSVGIGNAKDAALFHDEGSNTFLHVLKQATKPFPNLEQLGLLQLVKESEKMPLGYATFSQPLSNGKDTLTGHLEMMGVETKVPFQTFTETGFPDELIEELKRQTGRGVIGNCSASGTEIIEQLGEEHMQTGNIIVYTSADSVLQIAAHEDIVPLEELYHICEIARELTKKEEWKVGRIIARPFTGTPHHFTRTSNRHDYALDPVHETVLDALKEQEYEVIAIGKISDIFNNNGITKSQKTKDNQDGIEVIKDIMEQDFEGLCFANLNDFDTLYGHRRDVKGYENALHELDQAIPSFLDRLKEDDLLIMTADHGNDPTWTGTDHTRENVPILLYSKSFQERGSINARRTMADIGATIADNFDVSMPLIGSSFLQELK